MIVIFLASLALLISSGSANTEDEAKKLNILMVSDFLFGHMAPLLPLGEELAHRGHNVTMLLIVFESEQEKYKRHVEKYGIHLWNVSSETLPHIDVSEVAKDVARDFIGTHVKMMNYATTIVSILAKHMNETLSTGNWNIVLSYLTFPTLTSCMHSIHKVPFVVIGHFPSFLHFYPSWPWPSMMQGAVSDNMGFLDRVMSIPAQLVTEVFNYVTFYPGMSAMAEYCPEAGFREALTDPGTQIPAIVHSVIGFEYSTTISPLTEYVGALVSAYPTPLAEELEQWLMSKPARSVVYISMGSLFSLDEHSAKAFLDGVMKANLSILWSLRKSNQLVLKDIDIDPNHIMISDWTPQFSVLQSRAIHSAILHGGINGLCEALWSGVPVLVFPQMPEQLYNAGRVHFNGLGILLTADTLSSATITESLKALDSGEYRFKVSNLQKMYRLAGGVKRAADLVEFYEAVGYAHLVPAYAKYQWSWVQYYNADVYVVLLLILAAMSTCCLSCCKCLCRRCLGNTKQKKD